MIKENFVPLAQALDVVSSKAKLLSRESSMNARVLKDLDDAGEPATGGQEAALVAELDTASTLAAWNEAVRVFASAVDENPWSPV